MAAAASCLKVARVVVVTVDTVVHFASCGRTTPQLQLTLVAIPPKDGFPYPKPFSRQPASAVATFPTDVSSRLREGASGGCSRPKEGQWTRRLRVLYLLEPPISGSLYY